jgi:hypothetical protein
VSVLEEGNRTVGSWNCERRTVLWSEGMTSSQSTRSGAGANAAYPI